MHFSKLSPESCALIFLQFWMKVGMFQRWVWFTAHYYCMTHSVAVKIFLFSCNLTFIHECCEIFHTRFVRNKPSLVKLVFLNSRSLLKRCSLPYDVSSFRNLIWLFLSQTRGPECCETIYWQPLYPGNRLYPSVMCRGWKQVLSCLTAWVHLWSARFSAEKAAVSNRWVDM